MNATVQVQWDGQVKSVDIEAEGIDELKSEASRQAKEISGHKATGKWNVDADVNGFVRGSANTKVMVTLMPSDMESTDDDDDAEDIEVDVEEEDKPKEPRKPKYEDEIAAAAEVYQADPSMSMKKALESQGVTPNQYNTGKLKKLIPAEVLEARTGSNGGGINAEAIKAAAEHYETVEGSTMREALEAQELKYNQYNMKRMKEHVDPEILEAKKSKSTAANQAIENAASLWVDDGGISIAAALREAGATDNQHNRRKFKEIAKRIADESE